jgi:thioredoxin-related protein
MKVFSKTVTVICLFTSLSSFGYTSKTSVHSIPYSKYSADQLRTVIRANPNDKYLFVMFGEEKCESCNAIADALDANLDLSKVSFYKVDAPGSPDAVSFYGARFPTYMILKGSYVMFTSPGAPASKRFLRAQLAYYGVPTKN